MLLKKLLKYTAQFTVQKKLIIKKNITKSSWLSWTQFSLVFDTQNHQQQALVFEHTQRKDGFIWPNKSAKMTHTWQVSPQSSSHTWRPAKRRFSTYASRKFVASHRISCVLNEEQCMKFNTANLVLISNFTLDTV